MKYKKKYNYITDCYILKLNESQNLLQIYNMHLYLYIISLICITIFCYTKMPLLHSNSHIVNITVRKYFEISAVNNPVSILIGNSLNDTTTRSLAFHE